MGFKFRGMLRFIVITFEVLALIVILRSAFVQFWLSDVQTSTSEWMLDLSLTIDNQQLSEFNEMVSPYLQDFSEAQTQYLNKITSSKEELNKFNMLYCHQGDKNPYLYGANLRYICGEILKTEILKDYK